MIRAHGHDLVVFQILAPEETQFDFRTWSMFRSLENQSDRVKLDPASIRDAYLANLREHLEKLEDAVTSIGGDYARVSTEQNKADVLTHFLRSRRAKLNRAGSSAKRMVVV